MKRFAAMLLTVLALLSLAACGKGKTVHCDHCGKEVALKAGSNIDEDWIIFCPACEEELFGDNPVVSPG